MTGFPFASYGLLEDEERVDRLARLQHLDRGAHAAGDAAGQDLLRAAGVGLMLVSSLVLWAALKSVVQPRPPRAAVEHAGVERELDARVLHAADVGGDEVREVGSGGDGHREDQVARCSCCTSRWSR